MRFNRNDWLLLVAASTIAALAMAVVTWASGAIVDAVAPSASPGVITARVLALALIGTLAEALATWLVLRRCISGLRLGLWLLTVGLGLALAAAAGLPAFALSIPRHPGDLLSLSDDPVHLLARWLTLIVAAVASLLPTGVLLQRVSGASAWPFVAAGTASVVAVGLAGAAMVQGVAMANPMHLAKLLALFGPAFPFAVAFAFGVIHGLILGAGLFVMARLARRPAQSAVVTT